MKPKGSNEIADATATNWTQVAGSDINGSWDLDGNLGIESNIPQMVFIM